MKPIIIRKAATKDIPAISRLAVSLMRYHHAFDPTYTLSADCVPAYRTFFRRCLKSRKSLLLIAEQDEKIVGYCLGQLLIRPAIFRVRKLGFLSDMFLLPAYRHRGIAGKFLDELYRWFSKHKVNRVELMVHVRNRTGMAAWHKHGFRDFAVRRQLTLTISRKQRTTKLQPSDERTSKPRTEQRPPKKILSIRHRDRKTSRTKKKRNALRRERCVTTMPA
jgi:GNAT superfamily N-acetyltransferase